MATDHRSAGPSTLADLEAMPTDDGQRYELVGGSIIVSPWPAHYGGVSFRLGPMLARGVPPGHASYRLCGLDLPGGQRVLPDLVVAPHTSIGEARLHLPVLLVVEVLCGLGGDDLALKRSAYAACDIPAYWLIDPEEPNVACLRLGDGQYTAYAEGAVVEVDWPLPATMDVAALARPTA